MVNQLYYGDNLQVLPQHIADESVDLIYLDPPFNSKRDYNLLFKSPKGITSEAQIEAFEDTWHWNKQAEDELNQLTKQSNTDVTQMMNALVSFLGRNDMTAYLTMMANRLLELHRVLKPTGSLYLHCDPTASHYLKIVLDGVFGKENFRNEITWKRTSGHNDARHAFGEVADIILFYTRTEKATFNVQYIPYSKEYLDTFYVHSDADGRKWRRGDLRSPSPRPNLIYDFMGRKPHPNGWAVSKQKMEELYKAGRLHFPKKGRWSNSAQALLG